MTLYTIYTSDSDNSKSEAFQIESEPSHTRLFPRSVRSFDQPVHGSFDEIQQTKEHENKPITYAFIENIVKRTFAEYMRVIQTQSDWLQHLLQLVREERNIRSRYNCSTDACIYKIQLFTRHIPPHLLTHTQSLHKKRVRRSIQDSEPDIDSNRIDNGAESSVTSNVATASDTSIDPPTELTLIEGNDGPKHDLPIQDDALRLSDALLVSEVNAETVSANHPNLKSNDGSNRRQFSNFRDTEKFNMERVSQKVLSEALSRQKPSQYPHESNTAMESDAKLKSDSLQQPDVHQVDYVGVQTESSPHGLLPSDTVTQTGDTIETRSLGKSSVVPEEIKRNTTQSQEIPPLKEERTLSPLSSKESAPSSPFLTIDLTVPAIPFGMNKFAGNPYEDCSGRFENYCYNADKCVYISVLETAACYCRTGYTGVRCDMYNLPQSLDILKSFTDGVIDTDMLSNVVEATARYTVNAALEEDILAHWPMDEMP